MATHAIAPHKDKNREPQSAADLKAAVVEDTMRLVREKFATMTRAEQSAMADRIAAIPDTPTAH